jgi:uncharacterized protein (TIGR02145 family)
MKMKFLYCSALIILFVSCAPENTPPVALVYSLPGIGDTTTVFLLDGKNSSDKESSYFVMRYRWDTNADGIWDTEYSKQSASTARFGGSGYRKYILEVADEDGETATAIDSVFILKSNRQTDTLTDLRDGKRYQIVRIGENWWMADNLHFGKQVQFNDLMTNNGEPEYVYFNNTGNYAHYGALYTWVEAHYYPERTVFRDICPAGWHIPSPDQWSALFTDYSIPFDILYYFGPSSVQNLGINMTGYYKYGDPKNPMKGEFLDDRTGVRYWTTGFTGEDTTRYFTGINFSRDSWDFARSYNRTVWIVHPIFGYIIGYLTPEACYVRCIKE